MQCRNLISITRNAVLHHRIQCFASSSYIVPRLTCTKYLHSNSLSAAPVKLAYASYETMNETKESSKRPVMIMHGLFGSKNNWNSLSKAVHQQTDRKVITIDARNHGDSPHSSEMTYKHMAEDVVQLMDDLGLEKSILVGHSMGGSAMMYVALSYPELVEKLIVVDMSPVRTSPSLSDMAKIFQAMRLVTLDGNPTLTKARHSVDRQLANTIKSPALRQFLMMNLVEADAGKFKWRVNLPVLEQNFSTQIAVFPNVGTKTFSGPTLFIGGANSDYIRLEDHARIRKLFPSAYIEYIAGANHWVHADKPAEFLKMLTAFINQPHS